MCKELASLEKVWFQIKLLIRSLSVIRSACPLETLLLVIFLLIQAVLPLVSISFEKEAIDGIAQHLALDMPYQQRQLGLLIAGWSLVLIINAVLNPWISVLLGNLSERLSAFVTQTLMSKTASFPDLSRFEQSEYYDDLQLLQRQASEHPVLLANTVILLCRQLVTVGGLCLLLIPLSWWLPLLLLASTLPGAFASVRLQKQAWQVSNEKSLRYRQMYYFSNLLLTDRYAKEVRLFNLAPLLMYRFANAFWDMHLAMKKLRHSQALWTSILSISTASGNAFGFYWVVQRALEGDISPGSVLLYVQSLTFIYENLFYSVTGLTELYERLLYMSKFFAFIDNPPKMVVEEGPLSQSLNNWSEIAFESVSFEYPDGRIALKDVSLKLQAGETVAIVGENGAGKTTIVKLLTRLYDPSRGVVRVNGQDLRSLNLEQWRQQIAVVFQDYGCYSFTLGENIAMGDVDYCSQATSLQEAAMSAGLDDSVLCLPGGYKAQLGKQFDGTELSGGQWQKLALARAFWRQSASRLFILDEPTAAMDPRSERNIYDKFAELTRGKTTLLITHRLAGARSADRVLVFKGGQLLEEGTHDQLLALNGEYALLWHLQAEQYEQIKDGR